MNFLRDIVDQLKAMKVRQVSIFDPLIIGLAHFLSGEFCSGSFLSSMHVEMYLTVPWK